MASELIADRADKGLRILDPAVGPGTFPQALGRTGKLRARDRLVLFDVDGAMLDGNREVAADLRCQTEVVERDYLLGTPTEPYDLAILNPPYVRQEWLDSKERYRARFKTQYGLVVPGTANLYVYFVVKVLHELRPGGRFVCLLYDSWQTTRFGRWLVDVLEGTCDALETVAVPRQPFNGRLIDATIIRGSRAAGASIMRGTFLARKHAPLAGIDGLAQVSDVFKTARGLRLKEARFFLCAADAAPHGATPFIKKLQDTQTLVVPPDHGQRALLIAPGERRPEVFSELRRRLAVALREPDDHESVLTWYRERPQSWFLHRAAPHAPFLFNYYLRGRPRHVLSAARLGFADNFYGSTPIDECDQNAVLALLNSTASCIGLLGQARNQGGGLAKLQLFEYREALVPDWRGFCRPSLTRLAACGSRLLEVPWKAASTLLTIDAIVASELADPRLRPRALRDSLEAVDTAARQPRTIANALA